MSYMVLWYARLLVLWFILRNYVASVYFVESLTCKENGIYQTGAETYSRAKHWAVIFAAVRLAAFVGIAFLTYKYSQLALSLFAAGGLKDIQFSHPFLVYLIDLAVKFLSLLLSFDIADKALDFLGAF